MNSKVAICGHFNSKVEEAIGGQTIRTRLIKNEISEKYNKKNIEMIDTEGWRKNPIKLLYKCLHASIFCDEILILPAHNGLKVFLPLFYFLTKITKKNLHYVAIGAWLADDLKKNPKLIHYLNDIKGVYVQTETLKNKLQKLKLSKNVFLFPNFKSNFPINKTEVNMLKDQSEEIKFCFFSRINENKGIIDSIEVMNRVKEKLNYNISLDIFGPIEKGFEEKFYSTVKKYNFCSYHGEIKNNESTFTLKNYHILLFPTKYFTEGFPGTILDAFYSGLGIISSKWESYEDVLTENYNAISFEFNNFDDLENKLLELFTEDYINKINNLKKNSWESSNEFNKNNIMEIIYKNFG